MERDNNIQKKLKDILDRDMQYAKSDLSVFEKEIEETIKYKADKQEYIKDQLAQYCKFSTNKDGTINISGTAYTNSSVPELSDKELLDDLMQLCMRWESNPKFGRRDMAIDMAESDSLKFLEKYCKYNWLKSLLARFEEPQQMKLSDTPKELQGNEAKRYLDKAKKNGLIDNKGKWLKGKQLLAYFASKMSEALNLGKGVYTVHKIEKQRVSWKPFEKYFGIKKGTLRLNLNDIQKTGEKPKDSELIDEIFSK